MRTIAALILLMSFSISARADDAVTIPDVSALSWQLDSSGRVYLRNLSQFNSQFMACCYNHYIDTTTQEGKAKWSAVLAYIAMGRSMTLYVTSASQPGPVTFVMN